MRLWHKDLIPVLPNKQLVEQWRECCAVASNIKKFGTPNNMLVNRIMSYKLSHFYKYCELIAIEMYKRSLNTSESAVEKIISITDSNIRMEGDCFITYDELFAGWHDARYLTQCFYNLQEKYDCGRITEYEWKKINESYLLLIKNVL